MNRIVKSYLTILNREQTGCLMLPYHYYCFVCLLLCTLTAFNLLHKKKTNLRTVMNLFWRSWNKLHVIFYILALRQVLINLCEKTQYLHNREFFFQKEKLFQIIRFWISREIAALFFERLKCSVVHQFDSTPKKEVLPKNLCNQN